MFLTISKLSSGISTLEPLLDSGTWRGLRGLSVQQPWVFVAELVLPCIRGVDDPSGFELKILYSMSYSKFLSVAKGSL